MVLIKRPSITQFPLPYTRISRSSPLGKKSRAVALILEFERFMSVNRIRMVDLFEKVDKDKGGTVDAEELREFLQLGKQKQVSLGKGTC